MKSIDSKVAELKAAEAFKEALKDLRRLEDPGQLDGWANDTRKALDAYEERLNETRNKGRDPDRSSDQERGIVEDLRKHLGRLEETAGRYRTPRAVALGE